MNFNTRQPVKEGNIIVLCLNSSRLNHTRIIIVTVKQIKLIIVFFSSVSLLMTQKQRDRTERINYKYHLHVVQVPELNLNIVIFSNILMLFSITTGTQQHKQTCNLMSLFYSF